MSSSFLQLLQQCKDKTRLRLNLAGQHGPGSPLPSQILSFSFSVFFHNFRRQQTSAVNGFYNFFASELCLSHSVYIKCHLLCFQHTFTPQQRKLFILQVESPLFDARVEPANAFSTPAACTDSGRACTNALSTLYLGHV